MTRDAIVIERLSKEFRVRRSPVPVPSLLPWRGSREDDDDDDDDDEFTVDLDGVVERARPQPGWALREVSLRVPEGAATALIGRNGSGKSTLLKILGRVTPPTSGRALVRGRVAPPIEIASALLENDRSGRDNILLLARFFDVPLEVAWAQMDEVISFAELEHVIDLNVLRYSSGLRRRLAFSAVLNMKPDILLADETLGVGDAAFRARCFERIEAASREGMTMLFASHDLELVRQLADVVVWLDGGRVVQEGPPDDVVTRYERASARKTKRVERRAAARESARAELRTAGARPRFATDVRIVVNRAAEPVRGFGEHAAILASRSRTTEGATLDTARCGDDVRLEVSLEVATAPIEVAGSIVLTRDRRPYLRLVQGEAFPISRPGFYNLSVDVPGSLLVYGTYAGKAGVWVVTEEGEETVLVHRQRLRFEVFEESRDVAEEAAHEAEGVVELIDLAWRIERTGG